MRRQKRRYLAPAGPYGVNFVQRRIKKYHSLILQNWLVDEPETPTSRARLSGREPTAHE